jgi:hypothetical protein
MTTQISIPAEGTQTVKIAREKAAAAVQAGAKAAGRMLFVDNLRVFLTVLVVLHHLAITYGASGGWAYVERPTTELTEILLSLFTTLDHFFFMGFFFLIAGYFVPASLDRKGPWQFLKDRAVRLGIPFLVFGFLLSPIPSFVWALNNGQWQGNLWQFYAWSLRNLKFNSGPLWFVETLLVFSAVYALGRVVLTWARARKAAAGSSSSPAAAPRPLTHRAILAFILILALFSFITRIFFPLDTEWHNLQFSMFPQYILLFAAGILAYRRGWLPDLPAGVRKVWSTAAIVCIVILPLAMVLLGGDDAGPDSGLTVLALILATWEAVYCPSMIVLLLSLFRQRLDRQGSLGRFLSQNAYTVYIIHAPVLVSLAWLLRGFAVYPLLKYLLVAPVAVGLCFLISHFIVRRIPLAEKAL